MRGDPGRMKTMNNKEEGGDIVFESEYLCEHNSHGFTRS